MIKEDFEKLSIEDKVKYLNDKLREGKTVIRIREDLGISEKALQREIKVNGYKYLKKERMYAKEPTSSLEANKSIMCRQESKKPINSTEDKEQTLSLQENIKDDLLKLLSIKEELFDLVMERRQSADKAQSNIIEVIQEQGIKIELDNSEIVKRTIRGNKTVFDKWDKFCNDNKQFNKQDLLSMALKSYIEKYISN